MNANELFLSRNTTFKVYGDIKTNHLEIINDLLILVSSVCDKHRCLNSNIREKVKDAITKYLIDVHWIPLLMTCDESNNNILYTSNGRPVNKTMCIDIMFTYKYHLHILYTSPDRTNHEHIQQFASKEYRAF